MHGVELYSSDGTAEGTKPVKDINPGTASSNPLDIIVTGDKLYLIASLDNNYQQLWVSEGTADGTQQLSNLNIDIGYYYTFLSYLTDVNGVIYFVVNNAELWKSDGTQEGTVMVINFYNFNYSSPQQLENVNGVLFFTSADNNIGTGIELFKSDGTAEGTTIVKDINLNPYESSNPSHLTSVDGLLYFAAYDGAGNTLWVSDGTEEGTQPVKNDQSIYVAEDYYIGNPFTVRNNMLFFQGGNAGTGNPLLCRIQMGAAIPPWGRLCTDWYKYLP